LLAAGDASTAERGDGDGGAAERDGGGAARPAAGLAPHAPTGDALSLGGWLEFYDLFFTTYVAPGMFKADFRSQKSNKTGSAAELSALLLAVMPANASLPIRR
jgi:hypothetical protein